MAKLIDLNGLAHVYSIIKGMLADKLGKNDTAAAAIKDGAGNIIVDTYANKTDISDMVKSVNGTAPDASGNVTVEEYIHPNSGVTAGTYRSVTVNAQGHVTGGSNPTLAIANGGTGATTAENARKNLGIKDIATYDVLPIANGGTGASTAEQAKINLGLSTVASTGSYNDLSDKPTNVVVDETLDATSTNAIQNKAVKAALDEKSDTTHMHNIASLSGTLPIANGGTGNTTGLAASATKLATSRTFRTNLASTSTASFNGTANVTPGVTGTLAITNGGTGATTAANALSNLGGVPTSDVANSANKIPRYNSDGHLVLPDGSEFWIA